MRRWIALVTCYDGVNGMDEIGIFYGNHALFQLCREIIRQSLQEQQIRVK